MGDVTSVGTPKAGVFAEGQAAVVADAIIARSRGDARRHDVRRARHLLPGARRRPGRDGRRHLPARQPPRRVPRRVRRPRWPPRRPTFGTDRIRRWFGRDWTPVRRQVRRLSRSTSRRSRSRVSSSRFLPTASSDRVVQPGARPGGRLLVHLDQGVVAGRVQRQLDGGLAHRPPARLHQQSPPGLALGHLGVVLRASAARHRRRGAASSRRPATPGRPRGSSPSRRPRPRRSSRH